MDMLRIIAMFMVLIVHADFATLGAPDTYDWQQNPYGTIIRYMFETFSINGVDVFVLLSGWFGINFKIKKLSDFIFQIFFFSFGLFLIFILIKGSSDVLNIRSLKSIFLFNASDYWFIKSYIILYLLSPFLNAFIEKATKKDFTIVLCCYLLFHTIYGWLEEASVSFTMNGTTGLSFIALYLIGRYIKLYPCRLTIMNKWKDLAVYIIISLITTLICIILLELGIKATLSSRILNYGSPLIWISSIHLVLFFSKIKFSNSFISYIGSSCLAVYLLHCNYFFIKPYYIEPIKTWLDNNNIIIPFFYIVIIYTVAILLDKVRLSVWKHLSGFIFKE